MPKLENIPIVKGELHLFIRNPNGEKQIMTIDDRWTLEKIDDTHYRVSPSLNFDYEAKGEDFSFHTTNPFIIEITRTILTEKKT
jgi:hypothetical protein